MTADAPDFCLACGGREEDHSAFEPKRCPRVKARLRERLFKACWDLDRALTEQGGINSRDVDRARLEMVTMLRELAS